MCASHALTWCDRDGKSVRVMTPTESAVLMGFPREWRLPHGSRVSQRAVGNALCVEMSMAIMETSIKLKTETPPPALNAAAKRPADAQSTSEYDTAEELHRILKRLRRMERVLVPKTGPSVECSEYGNAQLNTESSAVALDPCELSGRCADDTSE